MTADELTAVVAGVRHLVAPLVTRIAVLEAQQAAAPVRETPAADPLLGTLVDTVGHLRERVAVVEARPPVPGPPGPAGADGLGFDDLTVEHDGRRTLTFRCTAGDRTRDVGHVVLTGLLLPEGRFVEGKAYVYGDVVTHDRSSWVCAKDTTTMPGTSAGVGYWLQLAARGERGRDAKA